MAQRTTKPAMSESIRFPSRKVRATLYLPPELLNEARDAAYHLAGHPAHMTLTKLAEQAFRRELERLKQLYNGGQDFPERKEDLKGGRPIAA
ncbi:hypothetical protein [Aeoliella sp.]|uniref:hypothetical protein n=1 Tax=Aeoliella sp. TaxID=2795800 RepID=UPI003CCC4484